MMLGFKDFAQQAMPGILDLLIQRQITSGLVVDLGCGSGPLGKVSDSKPLSGPGN